MKNIYKTFKYLFILNLILLLGCDASNITSSEIESSEAKYQHVQSVGTWNGPYAYLGSGITTSYAPQYNNHFNFDIDEIIFTRNSSSQVLQVDNTILSDPCGSLGHVYTDNAPSVIGHTQQTVLIAYKPTGSNSVVIDKRQEYGSSYIGLCPSALAPGVSTNQGPTLVSILSGGAGKFVLFYKSSSSNTIYEQTVTYSIFPNESSWSTPKPIAGTNTKTTPSATVFNNKIYLFYKGPSSTTIYYRYRNTGGSTWSSEFSLNTSESRTPSTPTVRKIGNLLYLVYRGEDNRIYYRTMDSNGNWSSQTATHSSSRTSSAPDIALTDDNWLVISYRDRSTNRPYYIRASYN